MQLQVCGASSPTILTSPSGPVQRVARHPQVRPRDRREPAASIAVRSAADLDAALAPGRRGLMLSIEGMEPLGYDPGLIDVFCTLGVRMASLTWNRRNPFADGVAEAPARRPQPDRPRARRPHGRAPDRVRPRARQRGHVLRGARAHRAIGRCSSATRSAAPLMDIPRNLSDDQLRALAERDGVVGPDGAAVRRARERVHDRAAHRPRRPPRPDGRRASHLPRRRLRAPARALGRVRRGGGREPATAIEGLARPRGLPGASSRRCATAATATPTCARSAARTCCACCAALCRRYPA